MKNLLYLFIFFSNLALGQTYEFPTDAKEQSGLKNSDLIEIASVLDSIYRPLLNQKNLQLVWDFDWQKPWLGAGSLNNAKENKFHVMVWGGYIRNPLMTKKVLAMTLCHELGHALGGPPWQTPLPNNPSLISSEGQADFFAATTCFPSLLKTNKINFAWSENKTLNSICKEEQICSQTLEAGLATVTFMQKQYPTTEAPADLAKPAQEKPNQTLIDEYPSYQCRLDTFKAGALCQANNQNCVQPRCWFVGKF